MYVYIYIYIYMYIYIYIWYTYIYIYICIYAYIACTPRPAIVQANCAKCAMKLRIVSRAGVRGPAGVRRISYINHHKLLHDSPLLKKTSVRQSAFDEWLPPRETPQHLRGRGAALGAASPRLAPRAGAPGRSPLPAGLEPAAGRLLRSKTYHGIVC